MYYPQSPKEPSGCSQTITITRMMLAILAVPVLLILGAVLAILLFFYALAIHPLLGLLVIVVAGTLIVILGKWEARRVEREIPRDE